jgi:hypothetical protein
LPPVSPNAPWRWEKFARLPDHRTLHASTSASTVTPLRFSHTVGKQGLPRRSLLTIVQLVLKLIYREHATNAARLIEHARPIFLYGCPDFAELPAYEVAAPATAAERPTPCECERTTDELMRAGEAHLRAAIEPVAVLDLPRAGQK